MGANETVYIAAITAMSGIAVAFCNTVGSVLMLWIRARYNYHEYTPIGANVNGVRNLSDTGGKPKS